MQQILSKISGTITQKKVWSTSFILVRDLKLKKFRTIRQNSVLWARFLMFLLHQILRHISSSEFAPNSCCRQRCGTVTFHPLWAHRRSRLHQCRSYPADTKHPPLIYQILLQPFKNINFSLLAYQFLSLDIPQYLLEYVQRAFRVCLRVSESRPKREISHSRRLINGIKDKSRCGNLRIQDGC